MTAESVIHDERSGVAYKPTISAFARHVMTALEQFEYRRCESGEDLEAIYRLRYKSFRTHGLLLSESADQKMVDKLDDAPNCYRFGIFMANELVGTVRVHHLTKDTPYAPIMTVFGDLLRPRLMRGETFIDPSRLAIDPDLTAFDKTLPFIALRPAVMANDYFDTTSCISMVRGEHTAFYSRIFGSRQIGEPRLYPPFTMPIYFYESRCDINMKRTTRRFPFFNSTAMERRLMFGRPAAGEPAPLTVLPTAKYHEAA